ncbi:arf/Sar family, other [Saprolegnia diclina VS20]|uniref:Arf/Sar family, other n=1 Tax=Saprolegnia diclina (strain VS20) TaxID=1156394 RepID=T0PTI5_SAPDV|nr:arf/Sar family, other [Saprolegnia diclina VS20]EQC28824.1 arf/Sar family, other [Saprolegnia diclina VS20]|eukprot:XP_008617819.1 arf/Sar family, other [Saprolegnia diclina VS20]
MGLGCSYFLRPFASRHETKMVLLGLDAVGKTTILYQLRLGECVTTFSTGGMNVETFQFENLDCTMWDLGSSYRVSTIIHHYYECADAIIFVVDANDRARIEFARRQLHEMAVANELKDAVLLVYGNKQDLPNAMSVSELTEALALHSVPQQWFVQACCATTGEGLHDGLRWLATTLCTH